MTPQQKAWATKLEKLLAAMPEGIELLVGDGDIHIHESGWYMREIWDAGTDMMTAATLIDDGALRRISIDRNRIRANSESI